MDKKSDSKIDLIKRLCFVKCLYRSAVNQSRKAGMEKSLCVLSFHNALDLFLYAAAKYHNVPLGKKTFLIQYPDKLKKKEIELINGTFIDELNTHRINLKHKGIHPKNSYIDQMISDCKTFFVENTPKLFDGLNFDEITLMELVDDGEVKGELEEAENSYKKTNYMSAVDAAARAYNKLSDEWIIDFQMNKQTMFGNADRTYPTMPTNLPEDQKVVADYAHKYCGQLMMDVVGLKNTYNNLVIGIDPFDFYRFQYLTYADDSYEVENMTIAPEKRIRKKQNLDINDARYCIDFVIDAAVKFQDVKRRFNEEEYQ